MKGLALDPAMANIGIVEFEIKDGKPIPYNLDIIQTKKGKGNVGLDDLRRAREIYKKLQSYDVDVIIAELPTGSQNARAAKGAGMMIGFLAMMDNLITVSPSEVKKVVKKNATKDEIISWALSKYPSLNWPKTKGKQEHIADALAVMELFQQ